MARTIANTKNKEPFDIDHKFLNLSIFQKRTLWEIGQAEGFEHLCMPNNDPVSCEKHGPPCDCTPEQPRKRGPLNFLWYQNGKLCVQKVGVNRIITKVIST